jgi:hypothetical protein
VNGDQVTAVLNATRAASGTVLAKRVHFAWHGSGDLTVFTRWLSERVTGISLENLTKLKAADILSELRTTASWACRRIIGVIDSEVPMVWEHDDPRVTRFVTLAVDAIGQALRRV